LKPLPTRSGVIRNPHKEANAKSQPGKAATKEELAAKEHKDRKEETT